MKKIIIIVICAIVAVAFFVLRPHTEKVNRTGGASLSEGDTAPDFTVKLTLSRATLEPYFFDRFLTFIITFLSLFLKNDVRNIFRE